MTQNYYYLSIGSNIEPEKNAAEIIKMLALRFGPLVSYPFFYTEPVDIKSSNTFLNSLAVILSERSAASVKQELNKIEGSLGRDRSDPKRSDKDRSADIDILACEAFFDETIFRQQSEPYVAGLLEKSRTPANLAQHGLPATEGAATIDLDASTGDIRILDDAANRLEYWQKAALAAK